MLYTELTGGIELKDKIVGQSIIGRDEFIGWVRERYIDKEKRGEVANNEDYRPHSPYRFIRHQD